MTNQDHPIAWSCAIYIEAVELRMNPNCPGSILVTTRSRTTTLFSWSWKLSMVVIPAAIVFPAQASGRRCVGVGCCAGGSMKHEACIDCTLQCDFVCSPPTWAWHLGSVLPRQKLPRRFLECFMAVPKACLRSRWK